MERRLGPGTTAVSLWTIRVPPGNGTDAAGTPTTGSFLLALTPLPFVPTSLAPETSDDQPLARRGPGNLVHQEESWFVHSTNTF